MQSQNSNRSFIVEACVESLEQAQKAEQLEANRIELCADLHLDGLTPDFEIIQQAKQILKTPIRVMIRPRAGNFVYSEQEFELMKDAIQFCKDIGVEGVVFGTLTAKNEVDWNLTNKLIAFAQPLKTIFHRAIESTPDTLASIHQLVTQTKIDAILTSGKGGKALDNLPILKEILTISEEKEIVVCGKVTYENLHQVHGLLGAKAYHGRKIVGEL